MTLLNYKPKSKNWLIENEKMPLDYGFNVKKAMRNTDIWNEYVKRYHSRYHVNLMAIAVKFELSHIQTKRIIYKMRKEYRFND